jgi:16S rRNA (guanine527-N7)-methyltransferase
VDTARIAALLEPFLERPLPEAALREISTYIDLLLRWNARINLTAVRDPEQIVTRHFGESFFLARYLFPFRDHVARDALVRGAGPSRNHVAPDALVRGVGPSHNHVAPDALVRGAGQSQAGAPRVLDLGSGAGFPGLPLKIFSPGISLLLVESNHRKAAFLREVARALTLTDVNVFSERAESLAARLGPAFPPADIVTLRAVERFESVLPLATRFLAPSGRLALLIGSAQLTSLCTLAPGLNWLQPIPLPESQSRVVSIGVHC